MLSRIHYGNRFIVFVSFEETTLSKLFNEIRGVSNYNTSRQPRAFTSIPHDADLSVCSAECSLHRSFHRNCSAVCNCFCDFNFKSNHQKVEGKATCCIIATVRRNFPSLLQCWRWRRTSALVLDSCDTEKVRLIDFGDAM